MKAVSINENEKSNGSEGLQLDEHLLKINEVRKLIGPLSGKLALYCSDSCIARYLRARNWNVKKSTKMLKASLKWRLEYKPEEIRWEDVASEAETGKIYRANYKDKTGRPVLIMRPRCQDVRPKATDLMPSDNCSNMMKDLFTPPRDSHHAAELWETYLKQIKETEGFDIDVYLTNDSDVIKPMFNDMSPISAETYYMLSNCSRISVDAYNQREGTDYTVNRIVKACTQTLAAGRMYFITFEAIPNDGLQVFQAKVFEPAKGPNEVLLVRLKA